MTRLALGAKCGRPGRPPVAGGLGDLHGLGELSAPALTSRSEQRAERHRAQADARASQEEPAIDLLCDLQCVHDRPRSRRMRRISSLHSSVIVSSRFRMTLAVAV